MNRVLHVAAANIRCQYSTGCVRVGVAVAQSLTQHWAARFTPILERMIGLDSAAFARVDEVLGAAGT